MERYRETFHKAYSLAPIISYAFHKSETRKRKQHVHQKITEMGTFEGCKRTLWARCLLWFVVLPCSLPKHTQWRERNIFHSGWGSVWQIVQKFESRVGLSWMSSFMWHNLWIIIDDWIKIVLIFVFTLGHPYDMLKVVILFTLISFVIFTDTFVSLSVDLMVCVQKRVPQA